MNKLFFLLVCAIALPVCAASSDFDRKTCPPETPLQDKQGWCYACDNPYAFETTEINCAQCKNREINSFGKCAVKICPIDQPMQDNSGFCYGCTRDFAIEATATECAKCTNRVMQNNRCVLKECTSDKPVRLDDGSCVEKANG